MENVTPEEFINKTFGGRSNQMDMSIYAGKEFDCICGKKHILNSSIKILRELSGMKLVFACPDDKGITCVKLKGIFRYKFISLFGAANQ